jgi:hypothetical protein
MKGRDTRPRNIQHTSRYTDGISARFKGIWDCMHNALHRHVADAIQGFSGIDHADAGGEIQRSGGERPRDAERRTIAPGVSGEPTAVVRGPRAAAKHAVFAIATSPGRPVRRCSIVGVINASNRMDTGQVCQRQNAVAMATRSNSRQ